MTFSCHFALLKIAYIYLVLQERVFNIAIFLEEYNETVSDVFTDLSSHIIFTAMHEISDNN